MDGGAGTTFAPHWLRSLKGPQDQSSKVAKGTAAAPAVGHEAWPMWRAGALAHTHGAEERSWRRELEGDASPARSGWGSSRHVVGRSSWATHSTQDEASRRQDEHEVYHQEHAGHRPGGLAWAERAEPSGAWVDGRERGVLRGRSQELGQYKAREAAPYRPEFLDSVVAKGWTSALADVPLPLRQPSASVCALPQAKQVGGWKEVAAGGAAGDDQGSWPAAAGHGSGSSSFRAALEVRQSRVLVPLVAAKKVHSDVRSGSTVSSTSAGRKATAVPISGMVPLAPLRTSAAVAAGSSMLVLSTAQRKVVSSTSRGAPAAPIIADAAAHSASTNRSSSSCSVQSAEPCMPAGAATLDGCSQGRSAPDLAIPEAEEAFMRSLGWCSDEEEDGEGADGSGLTAEEIATFMAAQAATGVTPCSARSARSSSGGGGGGGGSSPGSAAAAAVGLVQGLHVFAGSPPRPQTLPYMHGACVAVAATPCSPCVVLPVASPLAVPQPRVLAPPHPHVLFATSYGAAAVMDSDDEEGL